MNAPVAWRWNPFGGSPVADAPAARPASAPVSASSPQGTPGYSPTQSLSPAFYVPSAMGAPQAGPSGLVLIPTNIAAQGRSYNEKYGQKEGEEIDPRRQVIQLSQSEHDIAAQVEALTTQPIDIPGAQKRVTTANEQLTQFLKTVTQNLAPEQQNTLQPLYDTAVNAKGADQERAQLAYDQALDGMLTSDQRKTFQKLNRASEDAQLNLQAQQIGQRIIDARAGKKPGANEPTSALTGASSAELLSLAQADGRALVAKRQLLAVDRQVQDLYGLVITPENQAKLEPKQQELAIAQQQLQNNPNDPRLQQWVKDAQGELDRLIYGLFEPNDRAAVRGYEAYQRHLQSVSGVLAEEADNEFNFYHLRALTTVGADGKQPTKLQQQEFQLARHKFEFTGSSRTMRSQALKLAASPDDEELGAQLDQSMVDGWQRKSALQVESSQFNYDLAVARHDEWLKANPQGANGVPPTLQAVNDAKLQLDQAKQQKQQLEEQLKPKEVGFWDRVLHVAGGLLEVVGGLLTMAFFGWTGVGAAFGAAMVVDGLFRTGHSISDWANGTVTDAPLSSLLQNAGVSRRVANGIDTGVQLVGTTAVGGAGSAFALVRGAGMLRKGAGALGVLSVGDNAQAGVRSIATGEGVAPYTIQWLQGVGLSQTQANYVMALGGVIGTGGAAAAVRFRAPGKVNEGFVTYDAANAPEGVTPTAGAPTRTADWHTRGAPKQLRTEIAQAALGPGATSRQVRKTANSMNGAPLVLLREVDADGSTTIVGAARVKPDTTGRLGRDAQGNPIAPHSAEIKPIFGTGEIRAQTIAAGTLGVEQFTKQGMVFWQTRDSEDASWVPDAHIKYQRVRREAPSVLTALPEAARPWGTTKALDSGDPAAPLPTQQQLKNLASIPAADRVNWPTNTRDLRYQVDFQRPLTTFGSERLGKLLHPMHKDSYLAQLNNKLNPVNLAIRKFWPKADPKPQTIGTIPDSRGGPDRTATYYPAGTMPEHLLDQFVAGEVRANAGFNELTSFNRHPDVRIPEAARAKLQTQDLVIVTDIDPSLPGVQVLGGAGITRNFKGFTAREAPDQFPWLPDKVYRGSTSYLGHVFGARGAGGQAVAAAADAAKKFHGARYFDFLTQWRGAQDLYVRRGAHLPRQPRDPKAVAGTNQPNVPMQVYSARFGTDAADMILKTPPTERSTKIQDLVDDTGGSATALQARLDSMDTKEAYSYATQAPDGTLLVRYEMSFAQHPGSGWQKKKWQGQDVLYGAQLKKQAALDHPGVQKFTSPIGGAFGWTKDGASWLNERVNPYSLKAIEPGKGRSLLRDAGYATRFGINQGVTTGRGMLINLAALQAATGNVRIVTNDDRAIYPFNGYPGSDSVAIVFGWTGTMVTVWKTGFNARGPYPLDENGLMPLGRAGPSLANPTGPKSTGMLAAARVSWVEASAGIRWFGTNDTVSAVSAVSLRPYPINVNGRVDIPLQSGGPRGLQFPHSWTSLMPTVSHAFYVGPVGAIGRSPHVSLTGIAQTAPLTAAERAKGLRGGDRWFLGSTSVSTGGWGYFATLNPAYGKPDLVDYGQSDKVANG